MTTQKELDQAGGETVRKFLLLAAEIPPRAFQAFLCGGFLANVIGNLSDEYWAQFIEATPCGRAGCDCHLIGAGLLRELHVLREDHKEHSPKTVCA